MMGITKHQRYYSHKVVKDYLGVKRKLKNRSIDVPFGFDLDKLPKLTKKHFDRLLGIGYNIQFIIT